MEPVQPGPQSAEILKNQTMHLNLIQQEQIGNNKLNRLIGKQTEVKPYLTIT